MMKAYRITKVKLMLLAALALQLFNTYCTRKLFPDSSPKAVQTQPHIQPDTFHELQYDQPGNELVNTVSSKNNKEIVLRSFPVKDTLFSFADEIIEAAKKYMGVPHCMGGTSMRCIDCSGLVLNVFASKGIELPHNAEAQSKLGTLVRSKDSLIKGDIVFFKNSYKTNHYITHSGIYAGNNSFIHASVSGVTITSLDDPWWKKKYVFGKR
ncbi:MAG: C40 family peptidase, partial [Methanosarcina sp.]